MEDSRYLVIDKTLQGFRFSVIQGITTLLLVLEKEGISLNELAKFKELKASAIANKRPAGKICPECSAHMVLEYLNISPRTMTEDDSKIVYTCINPHCMNQIFE